MVCRTIYKVRGVKTLTSLFLDGGAKLNPTDVGNAILFEEGLAALSSFMGVDISRVRPPFHFHPC